MGDFLVRNIYEIFQRDILVRYPHEMSFVTPWLEILVRYFNEISW